MAIDYGRKRCGIAVTDPLRIVASGLTTVRACDLNDFVANYAAKEGIDYIVVGLPRQLDGTPSESTQWLKPAMKQLRKRVPEIPIEYFDERFTSKLAHQAMIDGGMPKMARRDKAIVDQISATILLNEYLQSKQYALSKAKGLGNTSLQSNQNCPKETNQNTPAKVNTSNSTTDESKNQSNLNNPDNTNNQNN